MINRFRTIFPKIEIKSMILVFEMDMDREGRHIVKISKDIGGKLNLVKDIQKLWAYGHREETETDTNHIIRTLSEADRQTLFSLKSLNPIIEEDGKLVFDIEPPVLKYLRRKKNIEETPEAKEVQISEKPFRPTAKVDFDPEKGLQVETGYSVNNSDKLIPPSDLRRTKDGKYARIGNLFAPLAEISNKAKDILQIPVSHLEDKDIPEFFLRDLVLIKKEFNAVLTDLAQEIQIVSTPLEPVIQVKKDNQGWLDFNVSYSSKDFTLPHGMLSETK
ncbi:unnamed protein product, partial [marine sediment metagenome]